jgi:flagellar hook protein FlgE
MIDVLDRKIRQMHAALTELATDDLSMIKPQFGEEDGSYYTKVDFNQDADEIALANAASLLITNIASMKDHLKVWCTRQGVAFHGDTLINSNQAVALIHDLWNIDKHAELNKPSRSGHTPKLQGLRKCLTLSTGTASGAVAFCSLNPRTGKITTGTSGDASVQLALVAQIIDENGNILGDFTNICTQAVDEWAKAMSSAGVKLP